MKSWKLPKRDKTITNRKGTKYTQWSTRKYWKYQEGNQNAYIEEGLIKQGQRRKDKPGNNMQNIILKIKDRVTRNQQNMGWAQ